MRGYRLEGFLELVTQVASYVCYPYQGERVCGTKRDMVSRLAASAISQLVSSPFTAPYESTVRDRAKYTRL